MNSRVDLGIGIHHLSAETLDQWGLNLETPTIKLGSVTSDGIRMFHSEMDIDVDQILSSLPINSLSESFSRSLGVDVAFQTPSFSQQTTLEGLCSFIGRVKLVRRKCPTDTASGQLVQCPVHIQ